VKDLKAIQRATEWNREHPVRRREIINKYNHKHMDQIIAWNRDHPKERNITIQKGQRKMRQKVIDLLGRHCSLCGKLCSDEPRTLDSLEFHKRDYKPHPPSIWWYILKNPDEFLPLCKSCHIIVTYLKKEFEINFEELQNWLASRMNLMPEQEMLNRIGLKE
jgi:hypothetical protein